MAVEQAPYPRAKWRLAPRAELDNTVLWVSHILVRHSEASSEQVPFGAVGWTALGPAPKRSRKEALQRAVEIVARARTNPEAFGDLAREFSDDVVTRDAGGSLGGIKAAHFLPGEGILDALAALAPGQVSEVLETAEGYEILYRRHVPDDVRVAGRRVVIAYKGAPWLGFPSGASSPPERSREEARRRAAEVVAAARAGTPFDALVKRYSDAYDIESGGDIGAWSIREPSPFPRELEVLSALRDGEVSEPLDSGAGMEVLQRTDAKPRETYTVATIKFWFDDHVSDSDPRSRTSALARARSILSLLEETPTLFGGFQKQYCCVESEEWTVGRSPFRSTSMLARLTIGEIGREPQAIEESGAIVIVKRLHPSEGTPPRAPSFELPHPDAPDLEHWIKLAKSEAAGRYVRAFAQIGGKVLFLDDKQRSPFQEIHERLAKNLETHVAEQRKSDLDEALIDLKALLGDEAYARYLGFVESRVAAWLMGDPRGLPTLTASNHAGP